MIESNQTTKTEDATASDLKALLGGRELDAEIAKRLLGWRPTKVGKDASGKNECEILTPDGTLDCLGDYKLPPKGKLHEAFLVPAFHRELDEAIRLCRRFGKGTIEIDGDIRNLPTKICRRLLAEAT